jgi:hypothetical protein
MVLPNLPLEIINMILTYRPAHPNAKLIKQLNIDANNHVNSWFHDNWFRNSNVKENLLNNFDFCCFHYLNFCHRPEHLRHELKRNYPYFIMCKNKYNI